MSTLPLAIGYFFPPAEPGVVFDGQQKAPRSKCFAALSLSKKEPSLSRVLHAGSECQTWVMVRFLSSSAFFAALNSSTAEA